MRNRSFTTLIAMVTAGLVLASPGQAEVKRTSPNPVCIGRAFEVQGSFGSRPKSYYLALYPEKLSLTSAVASQPLMRWPQSDISWSGSKLAVKARGWKWHGGGLAGCATRDRPPGGRFRFRFEGHPAVG